MNRSDGLISNLGAKSPITEAYRVLRTNLEFISPDNPIKCILFTSSGPGEGKSLTTANTAVSMTQKGKKVLLIDCDLRKPVQHKIFGASNLQGITNLLVEPDVTLSDVIQTNVVDNLDLLTSGPIPPIPAELLGSQKMLNLMNELRSKYDFIVVDTPPVISVTDAAILSSLVDGVILVVAVGLADRKMVKKAQDLLMKVNAHMLGIVVNREEIKKGYEYYYYYYSKGDNYAG